MKEADAIITNNRIVLTRQMREERYQGQHGAQPSSSMILHAGCFCERYRAALFSPSSSADDDDDETDLVVPHSSLLLTVTHCCIPTLNNIRERHTRHCHSLVANLARHSSVTARYIIFLFR